MICACLGSSLTRASSGETSDLRQVFLIQNSGWMEPFYLDPNSPLRPFLSNLINKSQIQGVEIVVASFNQDGQVAGQRSPQVEFSGAYNKNQIDAAIQRLDLPRKASGAYADADFKGALSGTFKNILKGSQGIIWIVTNNKDAPDNNPQVLENTRAFYNALRQSTHITSIAAFPMRKEVAGPRFKERGLIIYAISYGDTAKKTLAKLLSDGSLTRSIFPAPPVRLKPLAVDPVELILSSASSNVTARVVQGRLIINGVPGEQENSIRLVGKVKNSYYPQNIADARFSTYWRASDPAVAGASIKMQPAQLNNVPANGLSTPITVELTLPKVHRQPGFMGYFEDQRVVVAEAVIKLDSMRFSLDPGFVQRISAISSGDAIQAEQAEALMAAQLPEVFLDYRKISSASMKVPVQITFSFSPWPLILLILALGILIAAVVFLIFIMSRARTYTVRVGTRDHRVSIKPWQKQNLSDSFETRAELTGRIFGPPTVKSLQI